MKNSFLDVTLFIVGGEIRTKSLMLSQIKDKPILK